MKKVEEEDGDGRYPITPSICSICGSRRYMAPEVYLEEEYGFLSAS